MSEKTDVRQTLFIPILIMGYFAFAAAMRTGIENPFLLTVKLNLLIFVSFLGFMMMLGVFWLWGKIVGVKSNLRQIYTLWVFSLVPTLVWFFVTSFLYLVFPPPRTLSALGKLYSIVFIAFSTAILLWKIILYYLTLRFSLKLDLWKILQISTIVLPVVAVYSLLMYKWGVFRIPFL